jgi:hypothetical protein
VKDHVATAKRRALDGDPRCVSHECTTLNHTVVIRVPPQVPGGRRQQEA